MKLFFIEYFLKYIKYFIINIFYYIYSIISYFNINNFKYNFMFNM